MNLLMALDEMKNISHLGMYHYPAFEGRHVSN